MKRTSVAIFGSTSHIAKGLIRRFLRDGAVGLHLYTRSPGALRGFLGAAGLDPAGCEIHAGYADFPGSAYDVVINCVGVGPLSKLEGDFTRYFTVTEEYDNRILAWQRERCPEALYVSLSSGAVYGRSFAAPAAEESENCIRVNRILKEDYYAIVRLNAEAKHRAFERLRIADLRVFAYFSRDIDPTDAYFINEVLGCVSAGTELVTGEADIVRDYLHPEDLFSAVVKCIGAGAVNAAFDVVSAAPVTKFEILDYFSARHGLRYRVEPSLSQASATGSKNVYCSQYGRAREIGYEPAYTSMDTIRQESPHILERGTNHEAH